MLIARLKRSDLKKTLQLNSKQFPSYFKEAVLK